jgi:toxin ParE1/3/4
MVSQFRLTPQAKEDLRAIWNYTFHIRCETQADDYITDLYKRFEWLAQCPKIGKHRLDVCEGYYCFPQGSHLIFYLIHESGIDIIGVPHKEMDSLDYFDSED